jgi:polyhydroxyalkanoate synthesis regulator phasin
MVNNMDLDTIILYGLVLAYIGEKGLALYKRVMADGKITLDEIEEIIEEVTDIADETKEMIENEG